MTYDDRRSEKCDERLQGPEEQPLMLVATGKTKRVQYAYEELIRIESCSS